MAAVGRVVDLLVIRTAGAAKTSRMVRISITAAAFEAVASTLPFGSVGFERGPDAHGERLIWIERHWLNKLTARRRPGESYSEVIIRLAKAGSATGT